MKLGVFIGDKCDIYCEHCGTDSGPQNSTNFNEDDLKNLTTCLQNQSIEEITFTGGEPFLYIPTINKIIDGLKEIDKVTIITNCNFAENEAITQSKINEIKHLDKLIISYDKYHAKFVTKEKIERVISFTKERNIKIEGSICVHMPEDVSYIEIFEKFCIDYKLSFVEDYGRAKDVKTNFALNKIIDLKSFCPEKKTAYYFANMGFTFCCGELILSQLHCQNKKLFFRTYNEMASSSVKKIILENTFEDMLAYINKENNYLSKCKICCSYFKKRGFID